MCSAQMQLWLSNPQLAEQGNCMGLPVVESECHLSRLRIGPAYGKRRSDFDWTHMRLFAPIADVGQLHASGRCCRFTTTLKHDVPGPAPGYSQLLSQRAFKHACAGHWLCGESCKARQEVCEGRAGRHLSSSHVCGNHLRA